MLFFSLSIYKPQAKSLDSGLVQECSSEFEAHKNTKQQATFFITNFQ